MIEDLLPHSKDMVLIDDIVFCDLQSIKTKAVIKNSPFIHNGVFPSYQLIELMAQTLGIYKSYMDCKNSQKVAFLIGARKFEVWKNFLNIGDSIEIIATLSTQDENGFGVYDCEIFLEKEKISQARISVLNPSENLMKDIKNA